MLTENIMHDCVFKILRAKEPESLECLCTLLTTIGKKLDTDKAKVGYIQLLSIVSLGKFCQVLFTVKIDGFCCFCIFDTLFCENQR